MPGPKDSLGYYPVTLDQQKCFAYLPAASLTGGDVSHRLGSKVLSIPIYGKLNESQRSEVIAAITSWLTA